MVDPTDVLAAVCRQLSDGNGLQAAALLERDYPFSPVKKQARTYRELDATRVFVRDGFIDRYTGRRLLFPPVLHMLSAALPEAFPYHPNWKVEVTHQAYWQLSATIDHVVPVARGGEDAESNWVTTSMALNSAKTHFTLEELNLSLKPPGDVREWDGLLHWFLEYSADGTKTGPRARVSAWRRAALRVLQG